MRGKIALATNLAVKVFGNLKHYFIFSQMLVNSNLYYASSLLLRSYSRMNGRKNNLSSRVDRVGRVQKKFSHVLTY